MANYILAQSWARANTQDRLWYVETEDDLEDFFINRQLSFGDKIFIMEGAFLLICGNEYIYDMKTGEPLMSMLEVEQLGEK